LLFQTSLGIDINEKSVSMVCLKNSFRGVQLAAHAIYSLDMDVPLKEKLETAAGFVKEFMEENRIVSPDIFMGISREPAIFRIVEFPLAVKENLRETIRYEMEKYVPISVDDIFFDCQVLAEDKEQNLLKVLLIVVKKDALAPYLGFKDRLNVGISGIETGSTAVVNYLFHYSIAAEGTYFVIMSKDGSLELGLIKDGLLNYSRFKSGENNKSGEDNKNLCGLITDEVKALKDAAGYSDNGRIKAVYCGAVPGDKSGNEFVNGISSEAGIDMDFLKLEAAGIPSSDLAPAFGLALKGLRKVPMQVNLLPDKLRKRPGRAGYYVMLVLTVLVALSVLLWSGGLIMSHRLVLNRLNAEIRHVGAQMANIEKIRKDSKEIEEKIDYLNALFCERISMLDVLKELSIRIPESAWVRDIKISQNDVKLDGHAQSASELIPLLEASPFFKDAVFLSAITKGKDGKEKFRIGLSLNPDSPN